MQKRSQVQARLESGQADINTRSHWRTLALAAVLGSAALAGCAVVPAEPIYGYNGYGDVVSANVAPPALCRAHSRGTFVGSVWIGGFWDWEGGRHVWRPGHYEHGRPAMPIASRLASRPWRSVDAASWRLEQGGRDGGRRR
jgi:hypothetical protein